VKLNFKKIENSAGGEPVIILHGLFGSLDNWLTIGKKLAESHTVYLVDQRNHGLSPHSDEFDYNLMTADLKEFIADQALPNIHLIGHSMGGKTAMQFACAFPELVKTLTVVDIAPKYYPPHHQDVIAGFHAVNPATLTSRNEAVERISQVIQNQGVQLFLLKNLQRNGKNGFSWKHNLPSIEKNILKVGEALSPENCYDGPSVFIRGSKSDYILDEDIASISFQFPDSEVKTINNAGHWVHAEQPAAFTEALTSFLMSHHG
jgi:esterase